MKEELEDQQWIDALSGKVAGNQTASAAETQAGVLRRIIIRQIEARPIYEPSPARFEMLLGEAKKQSQIVSSPLEAAQAWQKDFLAAGVAYTVSYEEPKRVLIRIQLTPAAIELLEARGRIQAPPGKWVTLVIEAEKTGS